MTIIKIIFHFQMLTIHLGQDEIDCFSAWVSSKEAGLTSDDSVDQRVNYGSLLLQALLEKWWRTIRSEEDIDNVDEPSNSGQVVGGNEYFSVPGHTPVIFRFVLYIMSCLYRFVSFFYPID